MWRFILLRMRRVLPTLLVAAACAACSPLYLARAAVEEATILSRRRPIARVIDDPRTDAVTRDRLRLVQQARDFAEHALGLRAGDSYTTYSYVDSDTLLLVVSGARKDLFEAYTWSFPIVGAVPYKGFFRFEDAFREAARLEAQGYDSYVRPSGAFSTLGWFNDPLLNTLLRYDDVGLAGTVIHEILHNTVYIPSRISFNESFANYVGERGAIEFFCGRDGPQSANCLLAEQSWRDNLRFGAFLTSLIADLEALYARTDIGRDRKLELREQVFEAARARFNADVAPALETGQFRGFLRRPLNNASLIGTRLYYDRLHLFEAVYQRSGGNFRASVDSIVEAVRGSSRDPYAAVAALAGEG
jgi:predicted aminopeptidase